MSDQRPSVIPPGASGANVLQFVRDAAGDPRLTWWEANFINGMDICCFTGLPL